MQCLNIELLKMDTESLEHQMVPFQIAQIRCGEGCASVSCDLHRRQLHQARNPSETNLWYTYLLQIIGVYLVYTNYIQCILIFLFHSRESQQRPDRREQGLCLAFAWNDASHFKDSNSFTDR